MDNDLISRQAAIDAIEEYFGDLPIVVHYDMLQLIKKLPSAERREGQPSECEYWDNESNFCALYRPSAERHGRWERRGYHLHCSCCDWSADLATPHCPGCGAYLGGDV